MKLMAAMLVLAAALSGQDSMGAREALNRGVTAFKSARYAEAVAAFQQAVQLDPSFTSGHLYLATAYMQQYIPGATAPDNQAFADSAMAEFQKVLGMDAGNRVAMKSIASLYLNQKKFDDAQAWYQKITAEDPGDADAYYSLGFIAWSKWYPAYAKTRASLGMRMEAPGPMPDGSVKQQLKIDFQPVIDEGMRSLERTLQINPQYDDAMAYMNLFLRERADLRDTQAEYQQDIAEANEWVRKTLAVKIQKSQQQVHVMPGINSGPAGTLGGVIIAAPQVAPPPPPPPPPPPGSQGGSGGAGSVAWDPAPVQRILVAPSIQQRKLLKKVDAVAPPLAVQGGIHGVVKIELIVGKDGRVLNTTVLTGHPLLIQAALDAVKQWEYAPTLLNGDPVEVRTTVEITF
jgi:TonB family protein